jgi:hypothetical protein
MLISMYPVLFRIGPLPAPTHDFFTVRGLLAGTALLVMEARRRGIGPEPFDGR